MRRVSVVAGLIGVLALAGAARAGGFVCELMSRGASLARVDRVSVGYPHVVADSGAEVRLPKGATILRVERVEPVSLREGDQLLLRDGRSGEHAREVLVFRNAEDLFSAREFLTAQGRPETARTETARPTTQEPRDLQQFQGADGKRYVLLDGKRYEVGVGKGLWCPKCRVVH